MSTTPEIEALRTRLDDSEAGNLEFAKAMSGAITKLVEAEKFSRMAMTLLAAAVARQPGVDPRRLLSTLDAEIERVVPPDGPVPLVLADIRSAIATIAQGG
jgi:hypothetical protein